MKTKAKAFDNDAISSENLISTWLISEDADSKVVNGGDKSETLKGTNGDDTINGSGGNDLLEGLGGNDTLNGGAGNDKIYGGVGDNVIKGGSGVDTAVLTGSAADYAVSYDAKGHLTLSEAGNETLLDKTVERIKFDDTVIDRRHVDAPVVTSMTTADGDQAPDATTTDSTVVINGTADAFARVAVYDGNIQIGVTVADAHGHWSFDNTLVQLSNGDHSFSAIAGYGNGLPATHGADATFTIDAAAYTIDLTTLSASQGFVIEGEAGDVAGFSVSSAGDVNGDGFDDIIIGAVGNDRGGSDAGAAYVIFGKAAGFGTDVDGRDVFDLAGLTAHQGFIIQGDSASDSAGWSVSSAGDVNGDGFDDIIVGATDNDDGGDKAGDAYVIFGTASGFGANVAGQHVLDLSKLSASQGFIVKGDTAGDEAGFSVSSAGDVNGDGFDDIIVGAPYGDDGGDKAGEAYVIFGTASGFGSKVGGQRVIDLTTLTAHQGFAIQGYAAGDQTGWSVSSAGDLNGDGFDDILVGAPLDSTDGSGKSLGSCGRTYIIYGSASGFGTDVAGRQVIDLKDLTASQGTFLAGGEQYNVGSGVSSAGDINGDGFDDCIIGASGRSVAYVLFGGDYGPTFGFHIVDNVAGTSLGYSVSSAGDINGDGFDDLIVGGGGDSLGGVDAGQAFVVFGAASFSGDINVRTMTASQGFIIQGDAEYDLAGRSVSSAGDINGDGFDDLIVGASGAGDDYAGEAYILYGGAFGGGTKPIKLAGTSAAEILMGAAGNDTLSGKGGADIYRSGAGNDRIQIADAKFRMIDAGTGNKDVVVFAGSGFTLDARHFSNGQLSGIEGFNLTKGDNVLKLAATDVFHFSSTENSLFTAAASHNSLVVDGDNGDRLQLFDTGAADAEWETVQSKRNLDGTAHGDYTFVNLVEHGTDRVLASIAVDHHVTLVL
jgi:hypothetical protein